MSGSNRNSISFRRLGLGFGGGILLAAMALYYAFDPARSVLFPACYFHAFTGLDCPGCGGQRAVHHLLHGEIAAAFHANALFVSLVPVGMWLGLRYILVRYAGQPLPAVFLNRTCLWLLIAAVVLFGIGRNLPGFEWLRP
jgi:hypothetical protein